MTDSLYGQNVLIDTEVERSVLEYRPEVKYEKEVEFEVDFPVEANTDLPMEEPEKETDEYTPISEPATQLEEFTEQAELLKELIDYAEEEIKETKIYLTQQQIDRIIESSPVEGPALVEGGVIDFPTYKKTFEDAENPAYSLIQDVVTGYAEDIEGNLALELYEDLKEMELTLEEGFYLFKESVLKYYVEGDLPDKPVKDAVFMKKVDEAVKKKEAAAAEIKQAYEKKEGEYYESLRVMYGTPEFFKKSAEYTKKKRPHELVIRERKTMKEMGSLVEGMIQGTDDCLSAVKSRLVLGSDIDAEEVMKVLENQAGTTGQLSGLLKLTQLSLKLQLNKQIQEKKQYRDVLKNINNLPRKKRAHDELLMAYELRNKMYLNMYDTLEHLESPSKKKGVEAFLNNVAGGMSLVQGEYESFLKDIYSMYASEFEVRKEKIDKTLEKENARAGYSLVLDYL